MDLLCTYKNEIIKTNASSILSDLYNQVNRKFTEECFENQTGI